MPEQQEQVQYTIAVDADVEKLSAKVTELLGDGWEPCGGLCALQAGLAQAVFRDPARVEAKRVRKTSLDKKQPETTEAS